MPVSEYNIIYRYKYNVYNRDFLLSSTKNIFFVFNFYKTYPTFKERSDSAHCCKG